MFMPGSFTVGDRAEAVDMLRSAGFGHLLVADGDGFEASPLPFLVDDELTTVRAHVAGQNPIWRLAPRPAFLAVTVSDAYVSPNWYPSKAEHGAVVPTWNYEVVYVHGRLVAHDAGWTIDLVRALTDRHEASMPEPWSIDDAPDGYVERLARGIVGVSLEVSQVEAKRKLSQNRDEADRHGAVQGLSSTGRAADLDVARAVERHAPRTR